MYIGIFEIQLLNEIICFSFIFAAFDNLVLRKNRLVATLSTQIEKELYYLHDCLVYVSGVSAIIIIIEKIGRFSRIF